MKAASERERGFGACGAGTTAILQHLRVGDLRSILSRTIPALFTNASGSDLPEGYIAMVDDSGTERAKICAVDSEDFVGVVYGGTISNGDSGWFVIKGKCEVYMDASSATRGHRFRIPVTGDTNATAGMAHDDNTYIDATRDLGLVLETKVGEGLTTCVLL